MIAPALHHARGSRQPGIALIEALIALLAMAIGMVALLGLQATLRSSTDLARQRGEALRIAQAAMETLRSAPTVTAGTSVSEVALADGNTTYVVTQRADATSTPSYKTVRVEVSWLDRGGTQQSLALDSLIGGSDPSMSAALSLLRSTPLAQVSGRAANVPAAAKDLGDGSSVFKPQANGSIAWVIDNITGRVTGRCTVPSATQTSALTASDVASCHNNVTGLLISGSIAFSWDAPPNGDTPTGAAIALDLVISSLTGAPSTPSYECFDDAPSQQSSNTRVDYHCLVYASGTALTSWSGTLLLSSLPLTGLDADKVCRYSADYNGNGVIDNVEHPAVYTAVTTSLANQNFLVIRGTQACPPGHAVDPTLGGYASTRTVQLQPAPPAQSGP